MRRLQVIYTKIKNLNYQTLSFTLNLQVNVGISNVSVSLLYSTLSKDKVIPQANTEELMYIYVAEPTIGLPKTRHAASSPEITSSFKIDGC
mgnify:CR=1 FL=1